MVSLNGIRGQVQANVMHHIKEELECRGNFMVKVYVYGEALESRLVLQDMSGSGSRFMKASKLSFEVNVKNTTS